MEVKIISREVIKPSSPTIQHHKPCRLSLLDQLSPTTYSPLILFYASSISDTDSAIARTEKLKKSLSDTLNLYYPFSGRVKDNLFVDHFNEGIPFLEAQVNCPMSHFMQQIEVPLLNQFVPCQAYRKESQGMETPIFAFQASFFSCGGMALGISASHKLVDAGTAASFFATWAAISRRDFSGVICPDFNEGSLFFPPKNPVPRNHLSVMESLWFTEGNYVTRRFLFDARAIATIKTLASGESTDRAATKVTRIEALSCFIWKRYMAATKAAAAGEGSTKASVLLGAVNLRTRTVPPMSGGAMGNLFWLSTAMANPTDTNTKLHDLVKLSKESMAKYNSDHARTLQGEQGFETISEYCNQFERLLSTEKPDIFTFTSWCYLGLTRVNFGWGEPYWVGMMVKLGGAFRNSTVLVETRDGKGIEAWITIEERKMSILEKDPEFLAFASPIPKISRL